MSGTFEEPENLENSVKPVSEASGKCVTLQPLQNPQNLSATSPNLRTLEPFYL